MAITRTPINTDTANPTQAWMLVNAQWYTDADSLDIDVNRLAAAAAKANGYSDVKSTDDFYTMAQEVRNIWDGVRF